MVSKTATGHCANRWTLSFLYLSVDEGIVFDDDHFTLISTAVVILYYARRTYEYKRLKRRKKVYGYNNNIVTEIISVPTLGAWDCRRRGEMSSSAPRASWSFHPRGSSECREKTIVAPCRWWQRTIYQRIGRYRDFIIISVHIFIVIVLKRNAHETSILLYYIDLRYSQQRY